MRWALGSKPKPFWDFLPKPFWDSMNLQVEGTSLRTELAAREGEVMEAAQ